MKVLHFAVALAALTACGKHNETAILHEEAVHFVNYSQPKLDDLQQRVDAIFARGKSIPGNLPGIEDVGRRLQEARDTLQQLHGAIGTSSAAPKSAVEKQADTAATDHNVNDLRKLVHDTEEQVETAFTIVNDDLDSVEAWIAGYDHRTLVTMAPPAPTSGAATGTPEPVNTPPAAQPAPAQPAPAQPAPTR